MSELLNIFVASFAFSLRDVSFLIYRLKKITATLQAITAEENDFQAKNQQYLQDYAKSIRHWKIELETGIRSLDEEIVYQVNQKHNLKKAMAMLKIVEEINRESSLCRLRKLDCDNEDELNDELKKVASPNFWENLILTYFPQTSSNLF